MVEDQGTCIGLTKTISRDPDALHVLKNMVQYLFYIEPKHYFYMLYFNIPYKKFFKFIKVEKQEEKKDELIEELKRLFGWSERELSYHLPILATIDRKFWREELGFDERKTKNSKTVNKTKTLTTLFD